MFHLGESEWINEHLPFSFLQYHNAFPLISHLLPLEYLIYIAVCTTDVLSDDLLFPPKSLSAGYVKLYF